MADIVLRFTKPDELIVDPMMGAGTTGVVAVALGRRFIGVDLDKGKVDLAGERITHAINGTL